MLIPGDPVQLIMVSYFRPNDLGQCLESILTNTVEPFHLTIIDNSSGRLDDTLDGITDNRITIYRNDHNLGKGRAFMQWYPTVMRNSNSDHFISIDPDLLVPPGWLTSMLRTAYTISRLGILAPVLMKDQGDTFDKQLARPSLTMHRRGPESGFVGPSLYRNRHTAGPLFLINRRFFESVGGYVQNQLYGNDDGELCKAAHKHKRFIGISTNVGVIHLENDVTNGYKEWKQRNVNKNADPTGYWD